MSTDRSVPRSEERRRPRDPLTDDRSWDIQDVAYFLNVSESTIRNLERGGQLPALPRIGKRVTFGSSSTVSGGRSVAESHRFDHLSALQRAAGAKCSA
jgi:hypothetical protein